MDQALQIAAIVLAAGSSTRFGVANKLLAEIDGKPLVVRVIDAIAAGGVDRIVVVTGHEADRVAAAVAECDCRTVFNEQYAQGMGTSVACGVLALDDSIDGALIAQGDMPEVDAALIARLCQRFVEVGGNCLVYPVLDDGRQGNPVIWPRRLFTVLGELQGDKGAKRLIAAEGNAAVRVAVAGMAAATDIDTPEELATYEAARTSQRR